MLLDSSSPLPWSCGDCLWRGFCCCAPDSRSHGTPDTLNLDAIMAQRVGKAPTTVRIIRLPTVRAVVAEAAPLVEYLEPFAPGSRTEPSPVLSLILKLALFRLSKKQVRDGIAAPPFGARLEDRCLPARLHTCLARSKRTA